MNYYITMKTNLDIFLHQFSRILYLSATAVFIFTMMADGTARADIYKHVDNEGVLHLTMCLPILM